MRIDFSSSTQNDSASGCISLDSHQLVNITEDSLLEKYTVRTAMQEILISISFACKNPYASRKIR